jgi:hypothetical protein
MPVTPGVIQIIEPEWHRKMTDRQQLDLTSEITYQYQSYGVGDLDLPFGGL